MSLNLKLTFLSLPFLIFGCAGRDHGWETRGESIDLSPSEQNVLRGDALGHWRQRSRQENLEESLSKFQMLHASDPRDITSLVYLARGYFFLGDGHMDNLDLKRRSFEKSAAFGEKALATNEKFLGLIAAGNSLEESLGALTEREAGALYWTAMGIQGWSSQSGRVTEMKYRSQVRAMMERVGELRPDYFYGAIPRYWACFFAKEEDDLSKSKAQFEVALKASHQFLGTQVSLAEIYWVGMGDKGAFKKSLQSVMSSTESGHPDLGPENTLSKEKARRLLEKSDELFN